ncbi:MAG: metallophosphoesterase [Finegoldia magna]|nr:metallophosphoesterase [Finegoldia magna]
MYLIVSALILLFLLISISYKINIVQYEIKSEKIDRDINILFLSDLHSCDYGINQKKLMDKIKSVDCDVILLGGDIVDDKLKPKKAFELLEQLQQLGKKIYYVHGNHEKRIANLDEIDMAIKNYNVQILDNEEVFLSNNIKLIGVDDSSGEILDDYENELGLLDENLNSENFNICMIHKPDYYFKKNLKKFDLMISGHTHGGQWRLPFVLNGIISPGQGLFPKYAGGIYNDDYTLVVSRGLAKEKTVVPRIFNRPEINLIKLTKINNS